MTYFSELPKIYYDFNIKGASQAFILKDISVNIRFQKEVLSQVTLYDEYDIIDGETPELLSDRIYGTPYYHWAIMLMNNRFDYLNEWPLSSLQFQDYVDTKYGHANLSKIHHYRDSRGFIINSITPYYDPYSSNHVVSCSLTLGSNIIKTTGSFVDLHSGNITLQITGEGIDSGQQVKLVQYVDDHTIIMDSPATGTVNSVLTFVHIIDPLKDATPVTNFEHETEINDSKRRIKLLHPSVLPSLVEQLKVLTNG